MKVTLTRLSTASLGNLAQRCIEISDKSEFTVVKDNPLLVALKTEYASYFGVFGKSTYSGIGLSLAEADNKSDNVFIALKNILSGFARLESPSIANDAQALYDIIQKIGLDIDKQSYASQAEKMDKLIEEFETPENAARFQRLNITYILADQKAAHETFESIYLEQIAANAALRDIPAASSLRHSLEDSLRNYFNLIRAMKSVDGWNRLYSELNELAKTVNATLRK